MRRRSGLLISAVACGLMVVAAGSSHADTVTPTQVGVLYSQMLVDTKVGPGYIFMAATDSSSPTLGSVVVTDLAGNYVTTLDGADDVGAIALSPDGSTLYATLTQGADSNMVAAIAVSTITNATPTQTLYPVGTGDLPYGGLTVQSGKLWVAYTDSAAHGTGLIGDIDLTTGMFEPQPAAGSWTNIPVLAADPSNSGVLVAVTPGLIPAEVGTFNTTTDPVTPLAAQASLGTVSTPVCANEGQVAVLPGGQEFIIACQNSANAYQTKDLTVVSRYATGAGSPGGAAIDADGAVAVGTFGSVSAIRVYKSGRLVNIFRPAAGNTLVDHDGLAWEDTTSGPRLAAMEQPSGSGEDSPHSLQVFGQPEVTNSALTLTTPSAAVLGNAITLTGSLTLSNGAALPQDSTVTVKRGGPGGTTVFPPITTGSDGSFTVSDTPAATGAYTYTASYAGVADVTTAATADASATVRLNTARLSLGGSTSVTIGKPVTITGSLAYGLGGVPAGTKVTVTRTASGTASKQFTLSTTAGGAFELTDTPTVTGGYTYTARYAGSATTAAAAANRKVSVAQIPTALAVSTSGTTFSYEPTVRVTAHLGPTYSSRAVSIYAQVFNSKTRTLLKTGRVDSHGNLVVSYRASHSTTFTALFAGDPRYAPKTVTQAVYVRALVSLAISGNYATKRIGTSTYRLYHRSAHVNVAATVAPNKHGECVKVEAQEYYQGAWHPNALSACGHLNASSIVTGYLTVNQADLGYPYRVRADYFRSRTDTRNLNADSGWLFFMVET